MDEMFDLDMVLSITTMEEDSSNDATKLSDTMFSAHNQLHEMPMVAAAGECTICMESFESCLGGKQVPCAHVFHSTCISEWLLLHNSCPLCRSRVFAAAEDLS